MFEKILSSKQEKQEKNDLNCEICKKYNPNIELINTNDEVPNLGYTLSNDKLLSTGFKFLYNLEDSIKEMITSWSKKDIRPELEYTVQGGNEYIDERGKISNYELISFIFIHFYCCSESMKNVVNT